jgi:DNA-binding XRE family transcriptional regulator
MGKHSPVPESIEKSAIKNRELPVPTSPVIMAALRALYAGGPQNRWRPDSFGRPYYRYNSRDGNITLFFKPPPDFGNRFDLSKAMYYTPRLAFIHSGSQRAAVHGMSVETADIFLILMASIARLRNPTRDIARIGLDEIARLRGVALRHGSVQNLYDDFKAEILRLSDLCLSMTWRDYAGGGSVTYGKQIPDRLLDIVDVEYKKGRETWTALGFRCGQALSHFLSPDGLRWIGYYSRSLLKLSPYHEAFTKKLGTYWTMVGVVAGKKGLSPRATPRTILDFCGEEINWRNPGHTVDAFFKALDRLVEIGVLADARITEPSSRIKGYFKEWLEIPITVTLSERIWRIRDKAKRPLSHQKRMARLEPARQPIPATKAPGTTQALTENPLLIRQFRTDYYLHQAELARALGISRQTLSRYERGLHLLPVETALKILQIWQKKAKAD